MITHPFAGFAAVAAATLHVHLKYWPQSSRNNANASAYLEQDARIVSSLRDVYPIAGLWTEGIQKLSLLYFNLARGSVALGGDPLQVRESVLKLLRTATGAAAREAEAGERNGSRGRVAGAGGVGAGAEPGSRTDSPARSTSSTRRAQMGASGMFGLPAGESLFDPTLPFELGGGGGGEMGVSGFSEDWGVGNGGPLDLSFFSSGWGWGSGI